MDDILSYVPQMPMISCFMHEKNADMIDNQSFVRRIGEYRISPFQQQVFVRFQGTKFVEMLGENITGHFCVCSFFTLSVVGR